MPSEIHYNIFIVKVNHSLYLFLWADTVIPYSDMENEHAEDMFKGVENISPHVTQHSEKYSFRQRTFSDLVAKAIVAVLARLMDILFQTRYGHRAVVLETIASVPGMVGGLLQHLKSLRFIRDDKGWIKILLDEAENERVHLLVYSQIAKPTFFERVLIALVQFFFYHFYFLLYLLSAKTAHRVVGYFEEQAIHSYEKYLTLIKEGVHENVPAPELARSYWNLAHDARLIEVVEATIQDEILHRDVNHRFAENKQATFWK